MEVVPKRIFATAWPAILLLIAVQTLLAVKHGVVDGQLGDPDSYTWLNRVVLLHDTGSWFEAGNPRIDPPYGHENHWSRPFDLLLLAGGWVGSSIFGFESALHGWGVLINLFLHALALLAIFWAFQPILQKLQIQILGLLFIAQMGILVSYYVGRPDHQSLLNLLFIVCLGCVLRLLQDPYVRSWARLAGFVSALGIWVGVEFVLVIMTVLVSLGLFWLFGQAHFAQRAFDYLASLVVFASLALFLEAGTAGLLAPHLDQISYAFVLLFTLIGVFWWLMSKLDQRGFDEGPWFIRLAMAGLGAGIAALLMHWLVPGFFAGPDPHVDELYWTTRIANLSEGQPLFDSRASIAWPTRIAKAGFWLGIIIPGVPVLVYLLARERGAALRPWVFLAVGLMVFMPMVFRQIRWIPYPVTLLLPLYAIFVAGLLDFVTRHLPWLFAMPLRVVLLVACSVGFLFPVLAQEPDESTVNRKRCDLASISEYVDDPNGLGDRPKNLLAFVDSGPELLYRTKHSIYSYPNHRRQPGYTDSYNIFTATDDDTAYALVRKRSVDLILVCPDSVEARFFKGKDDSETFHTRLANGAAPRWLVEASPAAGPPASFKVYEVRTDTGR